jgi:AcrR family transcriptional regulator
VPRPNRSNERRAAFLPAIAQAFAELGYRRTTTAELARRLDVQENTLFRLWPDKKAMFLAAIEHVYEGTEDSWQSLLQAHAPQSATAAERLLAHEARHHGESRLYRIVFAGLNEVDDPEVRRALRQMFQRFHRFVSQQIDAHRGGVDHEPEPELAAWGIVGLGLMSDVTQELKLLNQRQRETVFWEIGQQLLKGEAAGT